MSIDQQEGSTNLPQLSTREKYWTANFEMGRTPASLRLDKEFLDEYIKPGEITLEIGSGWGRVAEFLAKEKGARVVGVDINRKEVGFARAFHSHANVLYEDMDGTDLALPDNSFNSVIMLGVLGGVEPEIRPKILEEACRVVEPGGRVAVCEFKMNLGDPTRIDKYIKDEEITGEWGARIVRDANDDILFIAKHFQEEELIGLLTAAGLESVEIREQTISVAGIGDGIVEERQQFTVWGMKPKPQAV